jgi:6,7-dimethyl-8-ribityllumazine synthase
MVATDNRSRALESMALYSGGDARVLVIEAPFYASITAELVSGATAVLGEQKVACDRLAVTGALEIPQALRQAIANGLFKPRGSGGMYGGVIALGCVIRGETSHYDIVCTMTNHWLMETAVTNAIPLGNGVLTVDTEAQALQRARGGALGKGGDAARACLRLMWIAANPGKAEA